MPQVQSPIKTLKDRAYKIRRRDLQMVYEAGMGHIGGDMSAIDILTTLYFGILKIDPRTLMIHSVIALL